MNRTLDDLCWESGAPSAEFEGRTVHRIAVRHVTKPGCFLARMIRASEEPIQALSIHIESGKLIVPGIESSKILLCFDAPPEVVMVRYKPSRKGSDIIFYNSWIHEDGHTVHWINHAGMLVEEAGDKMTLHCSDGWYAPTFDNLVVEIEFLNDETGRDL